MHDKAVCVFGVLIRRDASASRQDCRSTIPPTPSELPVVTNFLENGGSLEVAQRIAGHADSRTTKLYDRRAEKLLVEDMERIRY
jgi:hypothetical protein